MYHPSSSCVTFTFFQYVNLHDCFPGPAAFAKVTYFKWFLKCNLLGILTFMKWLRLEGCWSRSLITLWGIWISQPVLWRKWLLKVLMELLSKVLSFGRMISLGIGRIDDGQTFHLCRTLCEASSSTWFQDPDWWILQILHLGNGQKAQRNRRVLDGDSETGSSHWRQERLYWQSWEHVWACKFTYLVMFCLNVLNTQLILDNSLRRYLWILSCGWSTGRNTRLLQELLH